MKTLPTNYRLPKDHRDYQQIIKGMSLKERCQYDMWRIEEKRKRNGQRVAAMSRFVLHHISSYRKPVRKLAYSCG